MEHGGESNRFIMPVFLLVHHLAIQPFDENTPVQWNTTDVACFQISKLCTSEHEKSDNKRRQLYIQKRKPEQKMPYLSFMFLEETTVAFLCHKAPCALKLCGMVRIGLVSWLVELTLNGFENSIVPIVRSVL
jgi:hypothetical protein